MKKIVGLLILLFTLNTEVMSQQGFDIQKEITVNVPAHELWEMVGPGFADVHVWSSNVDHAEISGTPEIEGAACSERYCKINVSGFNAINEKITNYDKNKMSLAYEVTEGMPSFITRAGNEWSVVPVNERQSKLVMKAEFRSKGIMGALTKGMMERKMNATLDTVLNDAKVYAETGEISEAKAERQAELARKNKQAA